VAEVSSGCCRCGDVQFEFTGDPVGSIYCYCTECQRRTGSDKFFGAWVPSPNFRVVKGEPTRYERETDLGNFMDHYFCPRCGTNLFVVAENAGIHVVYVTALDKPLDLVPDMLLFTASAPDWAMFPEGVPSFDGMPDPDLIPQQP